MLSQIFSRLALAAGLIGCVVLPVSCTTAPVIPGSGTVDFSHYDQPLTEQVTERIQANVYERLGKGRSTHDRYFIIPFAYENRGNEPHFSHSFISVIRVLADGSRSTLTPELRTRRYKDRAFEAFTISWLPDDFPKNPHLCVFEGFGALVVPSCNQCAAVPGKSFDLPTTLKLAVSAQVAVGMWGPYEITRPGFDLGVKRLRVLEAGKVKYLADDRISRKKGTAINCFHAMSSLDELYPTGGFLGTGFKGWGLNGTRHVLKEYTTKASNKGLLLEPVDIEKDVIGFVYAPERGSTKVYNPFTNASAYRR
ncbi:MAG: hypothetical protein V4662_05055 [Verrucomicrobiota bacterium]